MAYSGTYVSLAVPLVSCFKHFYIACVLSKVLPKFSTLPGPGKVGTADQNSG